MPWNPEIYNQFKNIRYQPFYDLMDMISKNDLKMGVDIGCGTGEQTSILSKRFDNTYLLGIDPSPEMLSKSKEWESENLHFKLASVEDFIISNMEQKWDLIFSNAALQWSNNHLDLFPKLISKLSNIGQLAIQMPSQKENLLNQILFQLVQEKPFADYLHNWKRESPLLTIDEYAQILFENGLGNIQIVQKVYPIIAEDSQKLFDFISGSSLIPYLERMSEIEHTFFISEFKNRIEKAFNQFPKIYAFKRLLIYGRKGS